MYTIEFQKNLLCYLVQFPDGRNYIKYFSDRVFDVPTHKVAFQILRSYYDNYFQLPKRGNATQFIEDAITNTQGLPDAIAEELRQLFNELYYPLDPKEAEFVRQKILDYVKEKETDVILTEFAEGKSSREQIITKLHQINAIDKQTDLQTLNHFLIQDRHHFGADEDITVHPTFLNGLNRLTTAGGFYSPQLIIFMSGPKHFKTGVLIATGIEYARSGLNVYYADAENGPRSIKHRSKQAMLRCTYDELYDPSFQEEMERLMDNFHRFRGGDVFIDYWPAGTATTGDVKSRLYQLREERNWVPDVIIWDSIDHFLPNNPQDQKRDIRFQIQRVYHEAVAINKEFGCFSMAPSQVNRSAITKKTFKMQDVSEDFGKIMTAHAVFAICATPEELDIGIRRIVPVAQREGVRPGGRNMVVVHVDEATMTVEEEDPDEYMTDVTDD